ncbi:hypothetical protein ZWY2020_025059 [Hordeum vulgare]|nr:hypothetical protein ZWY2020_025059 [Hordeum vulgare]
MVSWRDRDSSESSFHYLSSASDDDMKLTATMEDSDFDGTETDIDVFSHGHGKAAERHVAFEVTLTGSRFLACPDKEQRAQMARKTDESKLQEKYDMLKNLTVSQANVIRNMNLKLVKEKGKLKIHNTKLEKVVEQIKVKLNGIKAILDE